MESKVLKEKKGIIFFIVITLFLLYVLISCTFENETTTTTIDSVETTTTTSGVKTTTTTIDSSTTTTSGFETTTTTSGFETTTTTSGLETTTTTGGVETTTTTSGLETTTTTSGFETTTTTSGEETTTTTIDNNNTTTTATIEKIPLTAPRLSIDSETNDSVMLQWGYNPNASSYEIYQSTNLGETYNKVTDNIVISYTYAKITGLNANPTYYFKVKAIGDDYYLDSPLSDNYIVKITNQLYIGNVSALSSEITDNSVTLIWNYVKNASDYELYQSSSSDKEYSKVTTNIIIGQYSDNMAKATITGLTADTTYYFKIKAIGDDYYLDSSLSGYTAVKTKIKLDTPTGLKVDSKTNNSVTLSWNSVANVYNYRVYKLDSNGRYDSVAVATLTSVTIDKLAENKTYNFKVMAQAIYTSSYVNSELSDYIEVTTKSQLAIPTGLKGVSLTANSLNFSWNNVANATHYEVYQSNTFDGAYTKVTDNITITGNNATISGLAANSVYFYKIIAIGDDDYEDSKLSSFFRAATIIPRKIGGGDEHNLMIDNYGNLYGWGDNWYGQLDGDEMTTLELSPMHIKAGTKFTTIDVNTFGNHNLAIDNSGNLWSWELDEGDENEIKRYFIVQIKQDTKFTAIAAGGTNYVDGNQDKPHSLAIDVSGNLWAWGRNNCGQLGDETTTDRTSPVQIKSDTKFTAIASKSLHSLAIDVSGNLWAWGNNSYGQLGNGTTNDYWTTNDWSSNSTPQKIKQDTKFIAITAGEDHSLAIDVNGNLWAWGLNSYGQLGDRTRTDRKTPVLIKSGTKFITIAAGQSHSLAIDVNGNLWAWGLNNSGQLGDGTTTSETYPVQIKAGTEFIEISAGAEHSLAIDVSGNLWTWGNCYYGRLGDMTTQQTNKSGYRSSPKKILPFLE